MSARWIDEFRALDHASSTTRRPWGATSVGLMMPFLYGFKLQNTSHQVTGLNANAEDSRDLGNRLADTNRLTRAKACARNQRPALHAPGGSRVTEKAPAPCNYPIAVGNHLVSTVDYRLAIARYATTRAASVRFPANGRYPQRMISRGSVGAPIRSNVRMRSRPPRPPLPAGPGPPAEPRGGRPRAIANDR